MNKRLIKFDNAPAIPNKSFQMRFISTLSERNVVLDGDTLQTIIPAQAGTQLSTAHLETKLFSRLRGNDGRE